VGRQEEESQTKKRDNAGITARKKKVRDSGGLGNAENKIIAGKVRTAGEQSIGEEKRKVEKKEKSPGG